MKKLPAGPYTINGDTVEAMVDPENSTSYIAPLCEVDGDWHHEVRHAIAVAIKHIPDMLAMLDEAQEAIDALSEDAEEAGYPTRARSAVNLAMRIRTLTRVVDQ